MEYESAFVIGDMLDGDNELVKAILRSHPVRTYSAGYRFLVQGEPQENLYLILEGVVECSFISSRGYKKLLSIHVGRWIFGVSSIDGNPNTMTFICRTEVSAVCIPPEEVRNWTFDMLLSFAKQQKLKERFFYRQIDMRARSLECRIVKLFDDLKYVSHSLPKDGRLFLGNISYQFISDMLGATKVQVSNTMQKLINTGLLYTDNSGIYLELERW